MVPIDGDLSGYALAQSAKFGDSVFERTGCFDEFKFAQLLIEYANVTCLTSDNCEALGEDEVCDFFQIEVLTQFVAQTCEGLQLVDPSIALLRQPYVLYF